MGFRKLNSMLYTLDGKIPVPVDPDDPRGHINWSVWFHTTDRHVDNTIIGKKRISTVFLGINHGYLLEIPPILFETMVFEISKDEHAQEPPVLSQEPPVLSQEPPVLSQEPPVLSQELSPRYTQRYGTWEEAEAGHKHIVEMVQQGFL